jgi:hypothetical protein
MMIDEVSVSGRGAYLRRDSGEIALQGGQRGVSAPVQKGETVEINAVDLYLEVESALDLFARSDAPLLSFDLQKEVFPSLFLDPHAHRVHQVAGYEDFTRSEKTNMVVLEIDGVPTLVSPGNSAACSWRSARYPLRKPIRLASVAWTLAASRGTPPESLSYRLSLIHWPAGNADLLDAQSASIALTSGSHRPRDSRHLELPAEQEIGGFQLEFEAQVAFDSQLMERHGSLGRQSAGTPLLQGVFLVENVEPLYAVHSLQELIGHSTSYQLLDPGAPLRRMTARVHLPAVLTEGESLAVEIHSHRIKLCEARLDATLRQRPPEPLPRQ